LPIGIFAYATEGGADTKGDADILVVAETGMASYIDLWTGI
jgi:hypothetical protein